MNARNLTALAMRVTGIVLLANWLTKAGEFLWFVPRSFSASQGETGLLTAVYLLGTLVVPLLIWLCLLLFADRIARRLVPGGEAEIALAVEARTLHVIAFSVLGAWLFATGLPNMARSLAYILMDRHALQAVTGRSTPWAAMMRTAPGVFRVVLGLFLFFRADALHAFWQKARPATPGAES